MKVSVILENGYGAAAYCLYKLQDVASHRSTKAQSQIDRVERILRCYHGAIATWGAF